jgi:hypothetical protein
MLQQRYDDYKEMGEFISFAVEGLIKLKPDKDGNYVLALEPHSDIYWGNGGITITLSPQQVKELTGLRL